VEVAGDADEEFRLVVGPDSRAGRGSIRGRLRLEDGSWRPCRVSVGLRPEGGGSSGGLSGSADPDGAFEIAGVPPGSWALRVSGSEEVAGELSGVSVAPGSAVEVEIRCRWTGKERGVPAELRVRPDPAPAAGAIVKAFATRQPSGPSEVLRAQEDGTWKGTVRTGAPCCVWVLEVAGMRAGVLPAVAPGAAEPTVVPLTPAGRLLLPGWEYGTPEPWVEVRDATDRVLYSGLLGSLPVATDLVRYYLLLPPGAYRVEVSSGPERKEPRTYTASASAGATTPLE